MGSHLTRHVTTTDGVTIGGTVHGHGLPLVFWHGALGDGDLDWEAVVAHLADEFTCHLPSYRGRGHSSNHPDLRFDRRVDDLVAYVDGLAEPTGLVGMSAGGAMALAAASRSDAVNAVAVHEPVLDRLFNDRERQAVGQAVARMGDRVAAGDLTAAARSFAEFVCNDQELAVLDNTGYLETAGRHAPNLLNVFRHGDNPGGPDASDPAVLGAISVPVLVLHGTDTKPFWLRFAKHVADHVPHARTRQIPAAGHVAALTQPHAFADALTAFFSTAQPPA